MVRLPLGSIQANGWLKHQLELMADGQIGHLEEISDFLKTDSGWLGGKERGWEEAAYWFRGFYDLAELTGNKRLKKSANRWIEAIVESRDKDGFYGSSYNRLVKGKEGQTIVDVWPHMVMNDVLISHFEATGDKRILPMMTRFFAFCRDLPDEMFLPLMSWDYYENYGEHFGDWKPRIQIKRAGDFVPQLIWLCNCFLSSKIPGFRRVGFPEKTAGNSRVLPSAHFADLCAFFQFFASFILDVFNNSVKERDEPVVRCPE